MNGTGSNWSEECGQHLPLRIAVGIATSGRSHILARLLERLRVQTRHGLRWHDVQLREVRDPVTGTAIVLFDAQDVTRAVAAEHRSQVEQRLLEMISTGERLPKVLNALVQACEAMRPELLCSVLLLDDQRRLRTGAAPRLPAEYSAAIDGVAAGPSAGTARAREAGGSLTVDAPPSGGTRIELRVPLA